MHEKFKLRTWGDMLCTEIVFDIQNNFCTQHVLLCSPHVLKKRRASDKDSPVHTHSLTRSNLVLGQWKFRSLVFLDFVELLIAFPFSYNLMFTAFA